MTPLSPAALAEIEERCNAATEGPWDVSWKYGDQRTERYCVLGPTRYADPIAATTRLQQGSIDAEFIAAARSDVPALVGEVRRLRDELRISNERGDAFRELVKEDTLELERLRAEVRRLRTALQDLRDEATLAIVHWGDEDALERLTDAEHACEVADGC